MRYAWMIVLYFIFGLLASYSDPLNEMTMDSFKEKFSDYYQAGEKEKIKEMIFSDEKSEEREIVLRLLSIGAGSFSIDEIVILSRKSKPPLGFEPFTITDSNFDLNIDWSHTMYFKASADKGSTSFIWPVGYVGEKVYFSGLDKR